MKVVFLHPPLYPVNHEFFNILGKYVELTIYCFGEYPRLHKSWSIDKFENSENSYKLRKYGKGAISLKTQLNPLFIKDLIKDKPDFVISIAFWIPSFYSALLKNILKFKFLILTDAINETEKNISFGKSILRKILFKRTDLFLAATELTRKFLKQNNAESKLLFQSINIGNWIKQYDKLDDKENLKKELNLESLDKIILGVGAFTDKKNWEYVFNQLDKMNKYTFILIGEGELKDSYLNIVEKLRISERVKILDRKEKDELIKYFKCADIFIFPSHYDQFGYVTLEALASGIPVLCTKNSGVSTIIQDNYNGFLIDPDKDCLKEFLSLDSNLELRKKNAFESVKQLSLENKSIKLLEILKQLKKDTI